MAIYYKKMINLDTFFKRYSNGDRSLGSRLSTMKIAVSFLNPYIKNNFVETGTTRKNELTHPRIEDRAADGCSTVLFAHYASLTDGKVWTCDIDSQNIENCKIATKEYAETTTYVVNDSIDFLNNFTQPIDFLYLDSVDSHVPFAADHQLKEIQSAMKNLHSRSIIVLDDLGAKTVLSIPFLQKNNWCQISLNVPYPSNYNDINQAVFVHETFLYTDHSKLTENKRFIER
jgi:hypothetical protein